MKEFKAQEVAELYSELQNNGITVWIDGGWAVDALLGKQTRIHQDLDIAVQDNDLLRLKDFLEVYGYKEIERSEDKKWDLVMADNKGHEIEVHVFALDKNGDIADQQYWNGYSKGSLSGEGSIEGWPIKCVSLQQLIKTHDETKRKFKESDYADMEALRVKFGGKLFIAM